MTSETGPEKHGVLRRWFADVIFRRVFKNAGFLLSGKTAQGLLSLGFLSLATHGLGIEQFGLFVLAQAYVQILTEFSTFHAWQAVIRYGALSTDADDTPAFQSLISFTTMLDAAGVLIGTAIGWFAAPLIGPYVGWSDQVVGQVQIFSLMILFNIVATPTGLLRLYDRFDVLAWQVTIKPAVRLACVIVCVLTDAPLWGYMAAWFVGGIAGGVSLVYLGWREGLRHGRLDNMRWSLTGVTKTHSGIWSFCFASNFHSSLTLVTSHISTFLVGAVATPAAAGLYKIAREVATALTKPAELLTQSIYPEFARMGSKGEWSAFGGLIRRAALLAGGAGLGMLVVMAFIGQPFLNFFFGADFVAAYTTLILLVAAAVITISGFSFDPALYAMGRPGIPLKINATVVLLVYVPLLIVLTRALGPVGAGVAMITSASLIVGSVGWMARTELRHRVV